MAAMDVGGKWYVGERIASEDHVKELMDPVNEKYKPDMLIYGENYCAVTDALGVCKFSTVQEYSLMPEDLAEGLSAVRGREISGDELLQMGEKIVCLERLYNASCGIGRKDDKLPARFTSERLPLYDLRDTEQEEPIAYGYFEDFEAMLDRYYDLRGWSREGIPTEETCRRLGLGDSQTTRKEG
jgi:aldehyde:ferredoxin oxidoreductase